MSYLPLKSNIASLTGDIYLRPLTASRPRSAGFADSFTFTPAVEQEPKYAVLDGVRSKIGTRIREKGATVSFIARSLRADMLSIGVQGTAEPFVQDAVTAGSVTATNVEAGEWIDLGAVDVTNVTVTDGTDPIDPADYTLYAAAGGILMRAAHPNVVVGYDAPSIAADAGRSIISILNSAEGFRCEMSIIGRNPEGKRFKVTGLYVALKPAGDTLLASDGQDLTNIELEGEVEIGPDADAPYGYIQELA